MRTLVCRIGEAFGDYIIMTPLLSHLKSLGHEVYVMGGEAAEQLRENNPNIDKFIFYKKDTVHVSKIFDLFEETKKAYECDNMINLTESFEMALSLHPDEPEYNLSKQERFERCNKNCYDYMFKHAGFPEVTGKKGELYYTEEERLEMSKNVQEMRGGSDFLILWGMTGSGRNKTYLHYSTVIKELLSRDKGIKIIMTGDDTCRLFEEEFKDEPRVIKMSGRLPARQAFLMEKYVDLVVCPDTATLHVAGVFDTPVVGLLGHNTKELLTKHFKHDYSIEADCECAPCFRLIYRASQQCPHDPINLSCRCMDVGLPAKKVIKHIQEVVKKCKTLKK